MTTVDKTHDLASLTSPRLRDDVLTARAKVHAALDNTYGNIPDWWRPRGKKAALRAIERQYVPAIRAIRAATSEDDLSALQANLVARLKRGWEMEATPKRNEHWGRLLAELEVVEDALSPSAITRHVNRLWHLESHWKQA